MGNRLSKIYTRTGDDGSTALANGSRASKSDLIFEVMGDIDELNSHIGMTQSLLTKTNNPTETDANKHLLHTLSILQHLLFNLGGELAMYGSDYAYIGIKNTHIDWLEKQIDTMNLDLKPLKDFILPAGTPLMCQLHITRSVCRRAERHAIKLTQTNTHNDAIGKTSIQFLNRLSDWLFVTARYVAYETKNKHNTISEVLWDKDILKQFTD